MCLQLFVREPEGRLGVKGNIRQHSFFSATDWAALEQRKVEPPFRPTLVSNWVTTDVEVNEKYNLIMNILEHIRNC